MKRLCFTLLVLGFLWPCVLFAKGTRPDSIIIQPDVLYKYYTGNAFETAMLSAGMINRDHNGVTTNKLGTVRFNIFTNIGFTFNFNLNETFGVYTGIDLKNIGFIENADGYTTKRRVYTPGAPFAVKVGKLSQPDWYFFLGGGADVPFNYREKQYQIQGQNTHFSEWLSERTPRVMPYVFAGFMFKAGLPTLKVQYYPGNFLNPEFTKNGAKPYFGYDVHLLLFTVGWSLNYKDLKNLSYLH